MTTLTKFPGALARYQDQMIDVFARAVPAKKFEFIYLVPVPVVMRKKVPMQTLP